jgi:hypothetical protein
LIHDSTQVFSRRILQEGKEPRSHHHRRRDEDPTDAARSAKGSITVSHEEWSDVTNPDSDFVTVEASEQKDYTFRVTNTSEVALKVWGHAIITDATDTTQIGTVVETVPEIMKPEDQKDIVVPLYALWDDSSVMWKVHIYYEQIH